MSNGNREGYWRYTFDTGKLEAEGNYKKDELTGIWKFYDQGRIKEVKNFDEEDPDGYEMD
jgi:antitoxin component YwqK of YwqJK toxin-antitoxin module